jgi:hypothetical protein
MKNKGSNNIPINEMNTQQLNEYNKLDQLMNDKLNKLNFKTITCMITKTKTGYKVKRLCHQTSRTCRAAWTMKIDVTSGEGIIYFNNKCEHN